MSVTTRTNMVTNPSSGAASTGYTAVAGTGGTAALSRVTSGGQTTPTFSRVTWSVATTAISGGCTFSGVQGIAAASTYAISAWVRSSITQKVYLGFDWNTNVGGYISTTASAAVSLTANVWTQIFVTGTAPATATQGNLSVLATAGGANWSVGATLDYQGLLVELGSVQNPFFDGSYVAAASTVYSWTGTANASTSLALTYVPYMTLVQGSTPSPNVQITYQDFDPQGDVINLWRTVDGKRRRVRGGKARTVIGSDFLTDYEAALGRTISYDIEVLSGVCAGAVITTATTTITSSASGWLSDPLQPGTAVAVYGDVGPNGEPGLDWDALAQFEYKSAVSKFIVAGTDEPVAQIGQRQAADGIDINMSTLATSQTAALRTLLKQAGVVLFRPTAAWASALPGLCYLIAPSILELPLNEKMGGQMVSWKAKSDIVAPPAANIVAPTTTYGTVAGNYATYAAFNAAHSGQQYLDVIKNP